MEYAYTIEVFRRGEGRPVRTWRGVISQQRLIVGSTFTHENCQVAVTAVVKQALGGDSPHGQPRQLKALLVSDLMQVKTIEEIRRELARLKADSDAAGPDGIMVTDRGFREAALQDVRSRPVDFWWPGKASEILDRLKQLPDNAQPEAVRSEFQDTQGLYLPLAISGCPSE